ncbi:MAG: DnaK suppressor protein [Campylobacterota bacterium]|nr:DnaK suppressor protein [Campylobacterota bacterium]
MRESELHYFEEILLTRKAQITKNLNGVEQEMLQLRECELNDEGDYASASNENLVESAIGAQQLQELTEIEASLAKIKTKQYGICDMCEDEIGFQRLKVKAHAKYCIVCRPIAEKNKE